MSNVQSSPHPNPFLERIILFLLPHFLPVCPNPAIARAEILETLGSYGGTSRSEVINAARVIAFSFAALDTLAEAKDPHLSPAGRLRHRGCANNLNRSCQQNEHMLAGRLACTAPETPATTLEPVNDVPDADLHEAIRHAEANIANYRGGLATTRSPRLPSGPLSASEQSRNNRLWGSAMAKILGEMGMPVQPVTPGTSGSRLSSEPARIPHVHGP
jgi:hypothetical protein